MTLEDLSLSEPTPFEDHDGESVARRPRLRFLVCGSVDDGKSTLIGRLLWDTKSVSDDHRDELLRRGSKQNDLSLPDFGLLLDGLRAEQEQGITIDVAYRYFATEARSFIVADTPGHEQYTRNMATGASTADLAVLLVDARTGLLEQTRRHAAIAHLMGIREFVLAINKIDLVGYDRETFRRVDAQFRAFAAGFGDLAITSIPVSALKGENVAAPAAGAMPWYGGPTLIEALERAKGRAAPIPAFRFPIQRVTRPGEAFRGYQGTVASGSVAVGDRVTLLPSGLDARIARISTFDGDLRAAADGAAVTLVLDRPVDAARGDMIVAADAAPMAGSAFDATVIALQPEGLRPDIRYWLKSATRSQRVRVVPLQRYDLAGGTWEPAPALEVNAIGKVRLVFEEAAVFDAYAANRTTGAFILVGPETNNTVAGGMIAGRAEDQPAHARDRVVLSLPADLARRILALDFVESRLGEVQVI